MVEGMENEESSVFTRFFDLPSLEKISYEKHHRRIPWRDPSRSTTAERSEESCMHRKHDFTDSVPPLFLFTASDQPRGR